MTNTLSYNSELGAGYIRRQLRRMTTMPRVAAGGWTLKKTFCGPLYVQIEPVSACNYACCFCRDHGMGNMTEKPKAAIMPLSMVQELAKDLKKMGTLNVEIIGRGEPLLHPRFLEIIETLRKNRIEIILYTNGALLKEDSAREMVKLGVRSIRVSINAASPESHQIMSGVNRSEDFEKILSAIEAVVRFKEQMKRGLPSLIYGFVLIEENFREASKAIEIAKKYRFDAVLFKDLLCHEVSSRHSPSNRKAVDSSLHEAALLASKLNVLTNLDLNLEMPILHEDYREMSKAVFSYSPCYLPWIFSLITSDGQVLPCCQCTGSPGNLNHTSFREIWKGDHYKAFRKKCRDLPVKNGKPISGCECDNCNYAGRNLIFHQLIRPFSKKPTMDTHMGIVKKMLKFKDI